jgi:hypothetical protein
VKKPFLLGGALVILVMIYFLMQKSEPVVEPGQAFVQADSAQITQLTVQFTDDTVTLVKEGESWVIQDGGRNYPANATNVGRALQRFNQMTRQAMITKKADRLAEFQLDDSNAVRVTFTQNGKAETILLGKAGPSFQTMYARRDGSDEVWEISGNHTSSFKRKAGDWRDKTITKLTMDDVTKLEFRYPTETITAVKADTTWHISDGKTEFDAPNNLVERVTRLLSSMNAVEFVDTLPDADFATPDMQLLATLNTGETIDLKLKKKDDEQYFIRKNGALSDFVIYNSTANVLMKKAGDFKPQTEEKK